MSHEGQQLAVPVGAHEIEQVLLGLADGSYVLSTPDGAVAESGVGVVALLGVPAEQLAGRRAADALVPGADDETRAAFERLLRADAAAGADARTFRATTAAGIQRALHLVVIAVPLALGWEFTSLLGELGSRDAGTWHPEALRQRHGRALETIERVCATGAQPDPGGRLAGILIIVRDVDAPPLTRTDVGRRMEEQRDGARVAAAKAARRADAATGRVLSQPGDAADDGGGLEDLVERARILRERVEEAEREAAAAIADRDHALAELAAAHAQQLAEAERRQDDHGLRDELSATTAERDALRAQIAAAQHELHGARAQLQAAAGEIDGLRGQLDATREELATSLAAADGARAEREQAHARASRLMSEAESARAAAEAIRAQFAFDEPRVPAQVAAPSENGAATTPGGRLELPPAGPGEAIALIGLDGTFKRLDDAFCSLLGCREQDLRAARWPSVIDRENLGAHREIARALRAGEINSAPVETVYMHAQGLLVPIAGSVTMHRAAGAGPATHYLFRAEVRRTSGA